MSKKSQSLWSRLNVVKSFSAPGYRDRERQFREQETQVDLDGQVAIVTGANSGIGFEVARELSKRGARTHLLCRNRERGEQAKVRLEGETPAASVFLHIADVGELASIRAFVAGFDEDKVDILVHNAGALLDKKQLTSDGNEVTFASHVLGPHLLTTLLLPKLHRASQGRVVQVASGGMYLAKLDLRMLVDSPPPFDGTKQYAQAKRAQVILNEIWADDERASGIRFACMHPGWVDTPGVETSLPKFYQRLKEKLRTPAMGADTIVWLCCHPHSLDDNGGFWFDRERVRTNYVPFTTSTEKERDALWARCEALTRAAAKDRSGEESA